jgi:chromosomal replication initiator protein
MTGADRSVWEEILSDLRRKHPDICRQWFEEIEPAGVSDGVFYLRVHKPVRRQYLQRECADFFRGVIQDVTGRLLAVRFLGPDDGEMAPAPPRSAANGEIEAKPKAAGFQTAPAATAVRHEGLPIVPDYSFEHFVEGPENRLALAAARAVAQRPGNAYNPLFVHGGVGLGKTHLLQAICLEIMEVRPGATIYYTSCEGFATQLIEAVGAGELAEFRHRFRDLDVLVIDDIHFLVGRDRSQEEFFHTFNSLYQAGKQIVLSSDAPPNEIPDLEARLVSRFQCGLVVPVNPPCYETRVQIVKQKARLRGLEFPDDVACFIAASVNSNIRELEGAITRVQMLHQTDQKPITEPLARLALNDPNADVRREITIDDIIEVVVDYYGTKLTDLQSKRRQKSIAHPRQVCMYLARRHTRYSLEEIGGYFGGRDHTTVMHAERTIKRKRGTDGELDKVLGSLEQRLGVGEPEPALRG